MFHKKTLLSLANINVPLFIRTIILKIVFLSLTVECTKLGINVAASIGVLLIILTSVAHCIDGFAFASEIEAGNSFGSRSLLLQIDFLSLGRRNMDNRLKLVLFFFITLF